MKTLRVMDHTGDSCLAFDIREGEVPPAGAKAVSTEEVMEQLREIARNGGKVITKKAGESESHIAKTFADMEDESTTLWHRQGG